MPSFAPTSSTDDAEVSVQLPKQLLKVEMIITKEVVQIQLERFSLPTTPGQTTSLPASVTGFNPGTKGNTGTLIYLHWTANDYNSNGSYHTVFAGDGTAKRNSSYDDYSIGHTEGKNSNAVGLSIAAAKGASDLNRMGNYPPTQAQLNAMTAEAAKIDRMGMERIDIDKMFGLMQACLV